MYNIHAVKSVASLDLKTLGEEAGFVAVGSRRYHCAVHKDENPSTILYEDRLYCFSCGRAYDVIDLAVIITGGSTSAAIRWLANRYGISKTERTQAARFSEETYANAELFRVGLRWRIERGLEALKELADLDEAPIDQRTPEREQILKLTTLQSRIEKMSRYRLVQLYIRCRHRLPRFVDGLVADAKHCHVMLATALSCTVTSEERLAA
jgi:hypothetical protein